jgi:hypothetical protein
MEDEHSQVEFLDPREDPDGIDWLDEEHVRSHMRSRWQPSSAVVRRFLCSLLVFAAVVGLTGYAGLAAYRHDQAVAAAANSLVIGQVDVGDPVSLTDPGQLGGTDSWQIHPSAAIAIGVTNQSPDAITLLSGSTLLGPGLIHPVALRASGATVLRPGQAGRLVGVVSVDCAVQASTKSAVIIVPGAASQGDTVLVQARTASGAVGAASVQLDTGGETVRQQICQQQGAGLATSSFPESVDVRTHSFTIAVSAHSLAAQPLHYQLTQIYPNGMLPGVTLSRATPFGAVSGVLAAGASVSAGFTVHVESCPKSPTTGIAEVYLQMYLDYSGSLAYFQTNGFDLATLVGAACGLDA